MGFESGPCFFKLDLSDQSFIWGSHWWYWVTLMAAMCSCRRADPRASPGCQAQDSCKKRLYNGRAGSAKTRCLVHFQTPCIFFRISSRFLEERRALSISQDRASRQHSPLHRAYLLMRGFPIPTKLQETQVTIKVKHSVVAGVLAGY